jgi:tRNA modification GTPase
VERARAYAKDADLVLYVVDSSIPLDENDEENSGDSPGEKKQSFC